MKQTGFLKAASVLFGNPFILSFWIIILTAFNRELLPMPEPLLATGIKKLCGSREERNNSVDYHHNQ